VFILVTYPLSVTVSAIAQIICRSLIKWREEKRRGKPARGHGVPRPRTLEDSRASILRKLDALARHTEREQLAQGWSRDETNDRMIPPG